MKGVILQRAAGHEYRAAYRRNLQMIDWRLAPPLGVDVHVDVGKADRTEASRVCDLWGIPATAVHGLRLSSEVAQPLVDGVRELMSDRGTAAGPTP